MTDVAQEFANDPEADRWNYRPEKPVGLNPLFEWPLRFGAVWDWYRGAWLQITALTLCMGFALVMYFAFLPNLETMQSFHWRWVGTIWAMNVVAQSVVAGTLHWWLYIRKGQGMTKKFEKRDLARSNGTFSFNNQVLDNIWWTLGSAMTVATVYQCVIFWAMANNYVPTVNWSENPIWCLVWMAFIPMWSGFHFYWTHRLEHHPRLYRYVHAVHHRNVNTGPWSGISNHWFENILYFTTYFIHLIVPSHPMHLMFHVTFQQLSPVLSHSGFERVVVNSNDVARAGDFFHQLHHRYFECNYGTSEIPFDKWFGTFHDGSSEGTARTRAHKKQMYTR